MRATPSLTVSRAAVHRPQSIQQTRLATWFERDRQWVSLQTLDGETILEWWDSAVSEAIEDGFLEPRNLHQSAYDYAAHLRLVGGVA